MRGEKSPLSDCGDVKWRQINDIKRAYRYGYKKKERKKKKKNTNKSFIQE
jgi:hypothetical protein